MLQIKINGQTMDIDPKSTLSMDLMSPYWLYDRIPSNEVKPPAFLNTARNQRVFGFWHETQSGGKLPEFTWQHFYGGELIKEGYFVLSEASEKNGYAGVFTDRLGRFFGDYQDYLLSDIDFGTVPLVSNTQSFYQDSTRNELGYCLPTIVNPLYYADKGASINYPGKVNDFQNGAYLSNSPKVPMFFLRDILLRIAAKTGVTIKGEFLNYLSNNNLILFNLRALDGETVVTVQKHLPELTIETFLLELRKVFNLSFDFNSLEKELTIGFWDAQLSKSPKIDWTDKAVRNESKIPEINPRIQLGFELDSNDQAVKDHPEVFQDYLSPEIVGAYNGIAPIKSRFSTLLMDETGLPICKQEGITSQFGQLAKKCSPKLLFWRGLQNNIPMASPIASNGKMLYWNGENGLKASFWQNQEALRANQFYLKKEFILTETDLAKLDFSESIHVNGMDYWLVQLSGELPINKPFLALLIGI